MPENNRVVLLAGASGLVGGQLLQLLQNDPGVSFIHVLSRKPIRVNHPKLQVHIVDFTSLHSFLLWMRPTLLWGQP